MSDRHSPSPRRTRSLSPNNGNNEDKKSPRASDNEERKESRHSRSRSPTKVPEASADIGNPGNNLYVANLSTRLGQQELEEVFSKFGRVEKCEVIVDPVTRESRGFGFVTFEDIRDAEDAVKELNNQEIQGRKIRVEHAKRKRGHEKTPGQYLGPRLASAKYSAGRDRVSKDRSRDRGRRSRSRDRGGYARRNDDRDRGRFDDRARGRGRYDDRERGREGYDRDSHDDRRRR